MGFGPLKPSHAIHCGLTSGANGVIVRSVPLRGSLNVEICDSSCLPEDRGGVPKEARTGDVRSGLFTTNVLEL